jgi:hypothetical protein
MSHLLYEGEVYHKRFIPKIHEFTYPFFLLDIDMSKFENLKSKYFSFSTKDHFGESANFQDNIEEILKKFSLETPASMRFITLPRMFNYVFNPISILVLFDESQTPFQMLVEVHNYNGGRIVYPVSLEHQGATKYSGNVLKDMYVSPFLKRDGVYKFVIDYTKEHLNISITLFEENKKTLIAALSTKSKEYTPANVRGIFFRHLFLTFRVVTRTLWQSLRLYVKGLTFNSVTAQDEIRRY